MSSFNFSLDRRFRRIGVLGKNHVKEYSYEGRGKKCYEQVLVSSGIGRTERPQNEMVK